MIYSFCTHVSTQHSFSLHTHGNAHYNKKKSETTLKMHMPLRAAGHIFLLSVALKNYDVISTWQSISLAFYRPHEYFTHKKICMNTCTWVDELYDFAGQNTLNVTIFRIWVLIHRQLLFKYMLCCHIVLYNEWIQFKFSQWQNDVVCERIAVYLPDSCMYSHNAMQKDSTFYNTATTTSKRMNKCIYLYRTVR